MSPFSLLGGGSLTPWLLGALVVALVGTNTFTAYKAYRMGKISVEVEWNKEKAERVKRTLEVVQRHADEVRAVEQKGQQEVTAVSSDYQKQLKEKEREIEALRRDVLSGKRRLSVPILCPERPVGVGVSPTSPTPTGHNAEERAELPAAVANDILTLGRDADAVTIQLGKAQALIEKYYELCGPKTRQQ